MKEYTERQNQIIFSSLAISAERGMHSLTIRNIAKALGVTEPAIYRHFASKHAILVAMLDVLQGNIAPHFMLLKENQETRESFFIPFLTALFTTIEKNPAFALFIFSEEVFHSDETLKPHLKALLENMLSNLEGICTEMKASEMVYDSLSPADIALIILSTVRLTVTRWNVSKERTSLVSEASNLNRLLCTVLFRE